MIECNNKIKELIPLYYDHELNNDEIKEVNEHVATCDECHDELEFYKVLHDELALDDIEAPVGFHQDMMKKLHESLGEESSVNTEDNVISIHSKPKNTGKTASFYRKYNKYLNIAAAFAFVILLGTIGIINMSRDVDDYDYAVKNDSATESKEMAIEPHQSKDGGDMSIVTYGDADTDAKMAEAESEDMAYESDKMMEGRMSDDEEMEEAAYDMDEAAEIEMSDLPVEEVEESAEEVDEDRSGIEVEEPKEMEVAIDTDELIDEAITITVEETLTEETLAGETLTEETLSNESQTDEIVEVDTLGKKQTEDLETKDDSWVVGVVVVSILVVVSGIGFVYFKKRYKK